MEPVTLAVTQAVARLVAEDSWDRVRDLVRRGDRQSAAAEVDRTLDEIQTGEIAALDERTKADARFKVLALASIDERPLMSTILGFQSAEKVGENLTKATWALVAASAALVVATVVLVIITAVKSL